MSYLIPLRILLRQWPSIQSGFAEEATFVSRSSTLTKSEVRECQLHIQFTHRAARPLVFGSVLRFCHGLGMEGFEQNPFLVWAIRS